MIEIPRSLARQLRAVFRRSVLARAARSVRQKVVFRAGPDALKVQAQCLDVAVEYDRSGQHEPEVIAMPIDALGRIAGRDETPVTLEVTPPGSVLARWTDGGIPQTAECDAEDATSLPEFPPQPGQFATQPAGFLVALHDAVQTAEQDRIRFALDTIRLGGRSGAIAATNHHALLIQTGFEFPWTDEVLVPRLPLYDCRELPRDVPVSVGKSEKHVAIRIGAWTIHLAIDQDGRFPNVESLIPPTQDATATVRLNAEDAEFLFKTLPRLPAGEEDCAPVTLDCNGQVSVRAQATGQSRPMELILSRSEAAGKPFKYSTNRELLVRALRLGFRQFKLFETDVPVLCQDDRRTYLWQGLSKDTIIAASDAAIRIDSVQNSTTINPTPNKRRQPIVAKTESTERPNDTADSNGSATNSGNGVGDLIQEAEALKIVLRDAFNRTHKLIVGIKRHRKHSRIVQTTLASLRQLQHVDA